MSPSCEAQARLRRYVPTSLSARGWALAKDQVQAAVLAAEPVNAEDAKGLVSRLCLFLAGPCGWDRSGAPDLAGLLTEAGIAAHLERLQAAGKAGKTRENHRADLRRLARAAAGTPTTRTPPATTEPARPSGWRAAVADAPTPFVATVAAWAIQAGRPLTRDVLDPVTRWLAHHSRATATAGTTGTVGPFSTAAALAPALAAAVDVPTRVVSPDSTNPRVSTSHTRTASGPAATTGSRPRTMSRAAALRHAKAAAQAAAAAKAGPQLAAAPDLDELPAAVREPIAGYRPHGVPAAEWDALADLTRRLVAGYKPASATNAGNVATHVVGFLRWVRRWPGRADGTAPLRPEELLTAGLVDAYMAGVSAPDATRATQRSVLRRAVRSLDASAQPAKIAYQPVAAPYDPATCAALVRLARHQPTPDKRRSLSFVVGLGLGAGLDGRDLRHVHRDSFAEVDLGEKTPGLAVTVGGTERPRTVVVRRTYEPLVREALALHDAARRGQRAPILGRSATRRNITTPVLETAVTAQAGVAVDIEVNRLRATWLVVCMCAAVPLNVLLPAAGLRSARTLTDLLAHCPQPAPADVATALAHLRDAATPAPKPGVRS